MQFQMAEHESVTDPTRYLNSLVILIIGKPLKEYHAV